MSTPITICGAKELAALPDPQWLIDNYLLDGSLALIHAAPGVGKSFLALDWCLSIAAARPWQGRRVLPGHVLYVAGEGLGGLKHRVNGWMQQHLVGTLERAFFTLGAVPLNNPTAVSAVITHATAHAPTKLIVFDTLARCAPGMDENSAQEMGMMIATLDHIRHVTKATVLLVHHSTKSVENPTARGSSAINGACDTVMELQPKHDSLKLICQKQKEADFFRPLSLRLKEIPLVGGATSCIIEAVA